MSRCSLSLSVNPWAEILSYIFWHSSIKSVGCSTVTLPSGFVVVAVPSSATVVILPSGFVTVVPGTFVTGSLPNGSPEGAGLGANVDGIGNGWVVSKSSGVVALTSINSISINSVVGYVSAPVVISAFSGIT